jgi:ribosome biogenesis GTPase
MEEGTIVKGISGFYYVETNSKKIVECKARGRFRKDNVTPVVGDRVEIELSDENHGVVDSISKRKNLLFRPVVANVDRAIVVFALKSPDISLTLMDKLLLMIEHYNIESVICLNKEDLDDQGTLGRIKDIYCPIGYRVIATNGRTGEGIDELRDAIKGGISVFSGPSGVGKSSISNQLQSRTLMKTGEISEKISRGRHTTRHAELIEVDSDTFIVDTPGFSSIDLSFMEPQELQHAFKEFEGFFEDCRFQSCLHNKEKECGIKNAVARGQIAESRYNAYLEILGEIQSCRRKR